MERLGRYRLVERLGEGGMGVVYRARLDLPGGFDREVVIKRLHPSLQREPEFARQLAEEARLSALLDHPSIVQVFEFARHGGERFLVMEYVDGVDLAALVERARSRGQKLPESVVAYVLHEAAAALAYAHALSDDQGRPLSIIHRDVSPSNLMVTSAGKVKLLDFGVARAASQVHNEKTRTGVFQGKLGYLSPEQAEGLPIDQRSDLFALGVVFHECLTLQRLFRGSDDLETLRLVRQAEVAPPPDLDAELAAVVMKLLARAPADRFAGGLEVVAALGPIVHRLQGDAAALRRVLGELGPFAQGQPLEESTPPRRRWLAAGGAAVIIAAGAVAWKLAPAAPPTSTPPMPISTTPISTPPAPRPSAEPIAVVTPEKPARKLRRHHAPVAPPPAAAAPPPPATKPKPHDPNAVKDPFG